MGASGLFKGLAEVAGHNPALAKAAVKYVGLGVAVAPIGIPLYWRTLCNVWSGKSLLMSGADAVLDEDFSDKGFVGTAKKIAAGQEASEKSTGEIVVDELGGQGTFAKGRETIGNTIDGASEALAYAGGIVRGTVDGVKSTFSGVGDAMSTAIDQHFAVTEQQQVQRDRELAQMAAYYKQVADQGYYPESMPTGQQGQYPYPGQSQGGSFGSMLSPFTNLINSFTGGSKNTMSAAGMILGAFMLFGGLGGGWLSRILGGALGGYAFRQMAKPQVQQTAYPSVDPAQYQQFLRQNYERQMDQDRSLDQRGVVNRTFTI